MFFLKLFKTKTHMAQHRGPQKWSNHFLAKEDVWKKRFSSVKTPRKEPKPEEFQLKFMHRIFRNFFILWVYCGEKDSINHTFSDCVFAKKKFKRGQLVQCNKHTSVQFVDGRETVLCYFRTIWNWKINCTLLFIIFVIEFE